MSKTKGEEEPNPRISYTIPLLNIGTRIVAVFNDAYKNHRYMLWTDCTVTRASLDKNVGTIYISKVSFIIFGEYA